MRICYVILSPTFGMHQYTADLANGRVLDSDLRVDVVTIRTAPLDRFAPKVKVHAIADVRGTGLQSGNFNLRGWFNVYRTIVATRGSQSCTLYTILIHIVALATVDCCMRGITPSSGWPIRC